MPRRPTVQDEEEQPLAVVTTTPAAQPAPAAATKMEAREANEIATVREEPAKSHTVLWIVAGAIVVGAAAAAGIVIYSEGRTATSSNVTLSWSH